MAPPEIAAKWSHWKDIDRIELWRAVVLTLDIDPRCFYITQTGDIAPQAQQRGAISSEHNRLISERLTVARSHLGGRLMVLGHHNDEHRSSISLPDFGAWAPADWNLSRDFPGSAAAKAQQMSISRDLSKPNWSTWSERFQVRLDQAVALSCDIDPDQVDRSVGPTKEEYKRRLVTATSHARNTLDVTIQPGSRRSKPRYLVSPDVFARWNADHFKWPLPDEFPPPQQSSPKAQTSATGWPWGTYETPHLKAFADAGKEFFSKPHARGDEPKSEAVAEWLEDRDVPKVMAVMMARIFRDPKTPPGPRREPRKEKK